MINVIGSKKTVQGFCYKRFVYYFGL